MPSVCRQSDVFTANSANHQRNHKEIFGAGLSSLLISPTDTNLKTVLANQFGNTFQLCMTMLDCHTGVILQTEQWLIVMSAIHRALNGYNHIVVRWWMMIYTLRLSLGFSDGCPNQRSSLSWMCTSSSLKERLLACTCKQSSPGLILCCAIHSSVNWAACSEIVNRELLFPSTPGTFLNISFTFFLLLFSAAVGSCWQHRQLMHVQKLFIDSVTLDFWFIAEGGKKSYKLLIKQWLKKWFPGFWWYGIKM